jgi:uncharacterized protein YkwD
MVKLTCALMALFLMLPMSSWAQDPPPTPAPTLESLTARVAALEAAHKSLLTQLATLDKQTKTPPVSAKEQAKRTKAAYQAVCTERGLKFSTVQIDTTGKSVLVCQ